jgi:hypothetical protein
MVKNWILKARCCVSHILTAKKEEKEQKRTKNTLNKQKN